MTHISLPHGVRPIPLVGIAEAGRFCAGGDIDWRSGTMVDGFTDNRSRQARHFALLLRSRSLRTPEKAYGYALCTDAADLPVEGGWTYAIMQKGGNGTAELCVRLATMVAPDQLALRDIIDGDVLHVGRNLDCDASKSVFIFGRAYAQLIPLT